MVFSDLPTTQTLALSVAGRRYPYMGTSSDHELAIARIVDQIDIDGRLDPSVVDEIIAALDFIPSAADNVFLVRYMKWRMENRL